MHDENCDDGVSPSLPETGRDEELVLISVAAMIEYVLDREPVAFAQHLEWSMFRLSNGGAGQYRAVNLFLYEKTVTVSRGFTATC